MNADELDRRFLLGGLAGAAGISALAAMSKAGPLNPPAGAVEPSGKTLTEVEPRTPVTDTTCPGNVVYAHVISQPGSYYLTKNINYNGAGILISADCTLDLNGFTVAGGFSNYSAIGFQGNPSVWIGNGIVTGTGGIGNTGATVKPSVFENIRVLSVGTNAFLLNGSVTIRNCTVEASTLDGIDVTGQALIEGCTVRNVPANGIVLRSVPGSVVRDCVVSNCTGGGIRVLAAGNAFGYARISRNLVRACSSAAIYSAASGCLIEDNVLQQNPDNGVQCVTTGCVILRNIVTGSALPFLLGSGNRYGPIVIIPGAGTPSVPGTAAASTMTSTDPNANYVF